MIIKEPSEMWYKISDPVEIIEEFQELIKAFSAKIKKFLINQRYYIVEQKREVKTEIGFLPPYQKDITLAAYGIIVTEGWLQGYEIKDFIEDISMLLEATNKKGSCTDQEYMALISIFLASLDDCFLSTKEFLENIIDLKVLNYEDEIVKAIIIRRNYHPALLETKLKFEVAEVNLDLRYVSAMYVHCLETKLRKEGVLKNVRPIHECYKELMRIYPKIDEEEILFDLIVQTIIHPYYTLVMNALKAKIELKKLQAQEMSVAKETVLVAPQPLQMPIDSEKQLFDYICEIVYSKVETKGSINEEEKEKLIEKVEQLTALLTKEKNFSNTIERQQYLMNALKVKLFELIFNKPQLVIPLIDVKDYPKFLEDPKKFLETSKTSIMQQLGSKLRLYLDSGELIDKNLSKAFVYVIVELLKNPSVYEIDL